MDRGGNSHQRAIRRDSSTKLEVPVSPTKAISFGERVERFLDSGMIQTVIGLIGGLAGTFLDGRCFVTLAGMVPFALRTKNVLEDLSRRVALTIHLALIAVALVIFYVFGVWLNHSRPGVMTPKDYAEAVRKVLPSSNSPTINNIFQPTRVIVKDQYVPPRIALVGPEMVRMEGLGALFNYTFIERGWEHSAQ